MKVLIFDSGPIINLSMNGLLDVLEKMHAQFDGKFIITSWVKKELVDNPLKIKQYELGAIRIMQLIEKKILEFPESLGISQKEIDNDTIGLTEKANHYLKTERNWISLVSEAEMSCFALAEMLKKRDIETMIVIDERTARMLAEKPDNLKMLMSQKLHQPIMQGAKLNLQESKIIRSPELMFIAFKKNLTGLTGPKALESLLYATKFKGSAISFEEIEELKRL